MFNLKHAIIAVILTILVVGIGAVPPYYPNQDMSGYKPSSISTKYGKQINNRRLLPRNVLAIMIEFSDVKFDTSGNQPRGLKHNKEYFERYMFHLNSYCQDASYGKYSFNYMVYDRVTLPKTMGYYGDDDNRKNLLEMFEKSIEIVDPGVDFNVYDAVILFHAGAGQESDGQGIRKDEIWSTFINLWDFRDEYDDKEHKGILTDEGVYITETSVCPEGEWQDYNQPGDKILDMMGVLVHEFGHQLGLPTLYDNISSNGRSSGIGNWGLMGTGAWNANGNVPPMMTAWSRYFLGWMDAVEITSDAVDLELTFSSSDDPNAVKLYKIPISDKEYFLIENRQQNPDGSEVTWYAKADTGKVKLRTEQSFSFKIVPGQDYYPEPNEQNPKFNFMKNTYRGCEWDFYLPGLGGPEAPIDGSGILIWHIDENIIDKYFTDDYEFNRVNSEVEHKGVDLEEASGVQYLDTPRGIQRLGYYTNTYRKGNNDYFGNNKLPGTDLISLPTSESYYGGTLFEIKDISQSGRVMTFNVNFFDYCKGNYKGESNLPVSVVDFDGDGDKEIFYPMPNGKIFIWDEGADSIHHNIPQLPISELYAYDENARAFLIPVTKNDTAGLIIAKHDLHKKIDFPNKKWGSHPVVNDDENAIVRYILPLVDKVSNSIDLIFVKKDATVHNIGFDTGNKLHGNLMLKNNKLTLIDSNEDKYRLIYLKNINSDPLETSVHEIVGLTITDTIHSVVKANFDRSTEADEIAILTTNKKLYLNDLSGALKPNFPVKINLHAISAPSVADIDENGTLDILIGGENSYVAVGYTGEVINSSMKPLVDPDSVGIASGVVGLDVDNNGTIEIVGNMSKNRFAVWNDINILNRNYLTSYRSRSLTSPVFASLTDDISYAFIGVGNSTVYRKKISVSETVLKKSWVNLYGNLQRTAVFTGEQPTNKYKTESTFVDDQTYIYPNPVVDIYGGRINFSIMTNKNIEVEIKIFDIAGNIIYKDNILCEAYMRNKDKIDFDLSDVSSGVYFVMLKAEGDTKKLKFAIEK